MFVLGFLATLTRHLILVAPSARCMLYICLLFLLLRPLNFICMAFHIGILYFYCISERCIFFTLYLNNYFLSFKIGWFFWKLLNLISWVHFFGHMSHIPCVLSSSPCDDHISDTWNNSRESGCIVRPSQLCNYFFYFPWEWKFIKCYWYMYVLEFVGLLFFY